MPDQLPDDPWFAEACSPLLAAHPEMVGAHAKAKGSASIRLLEPSALKRRTAHGVVLIMVQGARPGRVFFPTPDHLRKHLAPAFGAWIDDWEGVLGAANPDWKADGHGLVSFKVPRSALSVAAVNAASGRLVERLRAARARR